MPGQREALVLLAVLRLGLGCGGGSVNPNGDSGAGGTNDRSAAGAAVGGGKLGAPGAGAVGASASGGGGGSPSAGRAGALGGTASVGGARVAGGSNAVGGSLVIGGAGRAQGSGGAGAGGSMSACWTGPQVTWMAADYVSRKWARWPIPNYLPGLPHPMGYRATAEGVLDQVTGLVWRATTNGRTTTWADALAHCEGLGEGWSLPTRIELTTIAHHDKGSNSFDAAFFSGAGWTWASTPWVVNQRKSLTGANALSWFINFSVGDSNNSLSQTAASAYSRCVRIQRAMSLPADHYTVAKGEVRDNYTCLIWQQGGSGLVPSLTRDQAVAYCQNLSLNGQKWRLPALNELASLVDDVPSGDVSPAIDHAAFPETSPNQKYWSLSGFGNPVTSHWTLNFLDGFTQHPASSTLGNVRCVR